MTTVLREELQARLEVLESMEGDLGYYKNWIVYTEYKAIQAQLKGDVHGGQMQDSEWQSERCEEDDHLHASRISGGDTG